MISPIRSAAFCPGCGNVFAYELDFTVKPMFANETIKTDIRVDPLNVYCAKCNRSMHSCDPLLAETLGKLNKYGYQTRYSCEGHWRKQVQVMRNRDTKNQILYDGYVLKLPYILFARCMDVKDLKKLYETAISVQSSRLHLNESIRIELQKIVPGEHRGYEVISPDKNFWKKAERMDGLQLWIGCNKPKDLESIESYDHGQIVALDLSQDFYQFAKNLVERLKPE